MDDDMEDEDICEDCEELVADCVCDEGDYDYLDDDDAYDRDDDDRSMFADPGGLVATQKECMMTGRSRSYKDGLHRRLKDNAEAMNYLRAALEDSQSAFLVALKNVLEASV
jgi:hypothetical protein